MPIEKSSLTTETYESCILLVDDMPQNLKLLASYLQDYNFNICVATSGEQALNQINFVMPDIILMDVMMPGMDGFETCCRLKADEKTKDIPVIFMTSLTETQDMLRGFEVGGIDYVAKPIQQAEVLARIDVHLRLSKLTKQLRETNQDLYEEIEKRNEVEKDLLKNQEHLEEVITELAKARDLAQQANKAKSIFLATMSHELRTPLNVILGFAQVLQKRPLDSDTLNSLQTIQQSGEHLLTLINDSLDIAKIEAGKLDLSADWIPFPKFLQNIASLIQARAEINNLQFIFQPSDNLPTGIKADETRLRQILLNLLGNAVKFTNKGSVTFRVCQGEKTETAVSPTRQSFVFEVEDTGLGLSEEDISRIFRPYEQAGSTAARHKGTGLGLAISQQLVQLMGGRLHVHSTPGQGSIFGFEVTFLISESFAEEAETTDALITGYDGPCRSVLIVDDIATNRLVLKTMLRSLGLHALEAKNGQQALDLTETDQPDLVLMDRWMPEMDGLTTIKHLRQRNTFKTIPIVAVSASIDKEDKALFNEAGASDFLPKPIAMPQLINMLQKHLKLEWQYKETDPVSSCG